MQVTEPYKLGSVNAKWNLGWRNGFTYKGFNLNFLVTARLGGIVISKTQAVLDQFGVSQASADARDAGKVMVGNVAVQPKDYYESVVNLDAYNVYSATNVRLQEASLGYTFPISQLACLGRSVVAEVFLKRHQGIGVLAEVLQN